MVCVCYRERLNILSNGKDGAASELMIIFGCCQLIYQLNYFILLSLSDKLENNFQKECHTINQLVFNQFVVLKCIIEYLVKHT